MWINLEFSLEDLEIEGQMVQGEYEVGIDDHYDITSVKAKGIEILPLLSYNDIAELQDYMYNQNI